MVLVERSTVALDNHRQGGVGEKKGTECADDAGFEHVDLGDGSRRKIGSERAE
jgi:hypothetical protein